MTSSGGQLAPGPDVDPASSRGLRPALPGERRGEAGSTHAQPWPPSTESCFMRSQFLWCWKMLSK